MDRLILSGLLLAASLPITAQTIILSGPSEREIVIPSMPTLQIVRNEKAVQAMAAFRVAAGDTDWTDFTGTGNISYHFGSGDKRGSARLILRGLAEARMETDVEGVRKQVVIGRKGSFLVVDGIRRRALSARESEAGIVVLPWLRKKIVDDPATALIDLGNVVTSAGVLHRIGLEHEVSAPPLHRAVGPHGEQDVTELRVGSDLYFDSETHLLSISAFGLPLNSGDSPRVNVVTGYSDYRMVGNSMIPFRITQTINGQLVWTLELTEVQLSQGVADAVFEQK